MHSLFSPMSFLTATVLFATVPLHLTGTWATSRQIPAVLVQTTTGQTQSTDGQWQQFSSPEGNFSILMPGKPRDFIRRSSSNPLMTMRVLTATQKSPPIVFTIVYNLTDVILTNPSDPSQVETRPGPEFLNGFRDGTVGSGKLLREQDVQLDGYSGKEIEFQATDGSFNRVRLYYANKRFYTLIAITKAEVAMSQEGDKFFNSFTLNN
jgi:hypothetical protein